MPEIKGNIEKNNHHTLIEDCYSIVYHNSGEETQLIYKILVYSFPAIETHKLKVREQEDCLLILYKNVGFYLDILSIPDLTVKDYDEIRQFLIFLNDGFERVLEKAKKRNEYGIEKEK